MASDPRRDKTFRAVHDGGLGACTGRRFGPYELLRRVGSGGMGRVYEARHVESGARVALKMLLRAHHDDPSLTASFIDEARIGAELSHPNIVPVRDFGKIGGTYYLTMPLIEGLDLRSLLQRCGGPLSTDVAALIAHEVGAALEYIHRDERGIVHRDVSPENVFITRTCDVLLGDFGVAKARARLGQTQAGQVKGKLPYLSPEQVRGDPVTQRADVFALGLLLFEMLTGRRANGGRNELESLAWATNPRVVRPSRHVPSAASVDGIVTRALARHPALRTRDAALFVDQLRAVLVDSPRAPQRLRRLMRRLGSDVSPADAPRADKPPRQETPAGKVAMADDTTIPNGVVTVSSRGEVSSSRGELSPAEELSAIELQWDELYESPVEWTRSLRGDPEVDDDDEPPTITIEEPPVTVAEPPLALVATLPGDDTLDPMTPTSLWPAPLG